MQLLSYNLLKNKAVGELSSLITRYPVDALCLQEVVVDRLPQKLGNLELAIGTEKNRLGLAIYVNAEKYTVEETASFGLRNSTYDRIAAPAHERLLGVRARNKATAEAFTVGSFHASPLTALNSIRRDQIHTALNKLDVLGEGSPLMMLGDFNYPVFRQRLEREVLASGYSLYTSDRPTYPGFGVRGGYFDFAAGRHITLQWLKTLKRGASDHLPILARLTANPQATDEVVAIA